MRSITVTLFLCLVAIFAGQPAHATIGVGFQLQLGNPSNATADPNNHEHYLVQREVDVVDYSDRLGLPLWASWDLTAGDIGNATRQTKYSTDPLLPPGFRKITDNDYDGVGAINFNRGHLCPSEDRTDTDAHNDELFFLSNILPQAAVSNQGVWGTFEEYCRSQARAGYEVLILCGPSGFGTNRLPGGKVFIPAYTWKIAVLVKLGAGSAVSRITETNRVIALKVPNTNDATNKWPSYVTSANEIQVDTGLTFFTALSSNIAAVLRSKVDGQNKPGPGIVSFTPTGGGTNTGVTITGTNFSGAIAVRFNGTAAEFTVDSATQITAHVPAGALSGPLSVTTPSGTAISADSFTVDDRGGYTGVLLGWDVSGATNYGLSPLPPTTNAQHVAVVGLTRGAGISTSGRAAARSWGGVAFTDASAAAAVAANRFVTFGLAATAGYRVSISTISRLDYRRSDTGAPSGVLQCRVGSGAFVDITNLSYSISTSGGGSIGPINVSGIAALQDVGAGTNITFRLVNYGGTSSAGTWYVYDVGNSAELDLAVQGSVIPEITPIQLWRQRWFGTIQNIGAAADDSVGTSDGLPNLLKYALGLDPTVAAENPVAISLANGHLNLVAPRNAEATDVTFEVQVSTDLQNWTASGIVVDQAAPPIFRAHDTAPVAGNPVRFMRLRVSSNAP